MYKTIIATTIIIVLIIGGILFLKQEKPASKEEAINMETESPVDTSASGDSQSDTNTITTVKTETTVTTTSGVKSFTVTGSKFAFSPSSIRVKKGDTVKITFKNADGSHDLRIDEFNVATKIINTGAEETVTFVADKIGTFEFYCSVGNHRAMGMKGTLIVE